MNDVVSVVVTCRNLERYIGTAIDSVLDQDYPGPVEVVVVDDDSSDASATIIQRRNRVRYLRTPENIGVLMATVRGLREASGDLVFFLDGDDVWRPDKLRMAIAQFEANRDLGLLTHDLEYIDADGRSLARVSRPSQVMSVALDNHDEEIRNGILLHSDYVWLGSAYAIRRSKIDTEGFCAWAERLPDPFNTYQDWPLAYWAACRKDAGMGYLPAKLLRYRLHGANYSGDASDAGKALRNVRRTRNTMRAMAEIASATQLPEPAMRATRRKLRYYDCMLDLYEGRRIAALRGLVASLPYLAASTENPAKELVRFVGVQLLGLDGFAAAVARWRRRMSVHG